MKTKTKTPATLTAVTSLAPTAPRLLTVVDASRYLNVHIWFVRTLAWERRVPFLKLGSRILFDRADLDAFVAQQKQGAR